MENLGFRLVFLAYAAAVVALGVAAWRRKRTRSLSLKGLEFWMANRELPGWRLAISLTSGWLMLGWIGFGMSQIYMYGATGLWILPIPWLLLCIFIIFLVPYVRRVAAVSLPQSIQHRFGSGARVAVAVLSILIFTAWTGAELFMAGSLLTGFLGLPARVIMVLIVLPIAAYTVLGSFRAIVTTDLLQFLAMVLFMVVLGLTAWSQASAASSGQVLDAIGRSAPPWGGAGHAFDLGVLGWVFPIALLVGYLPGWAVEQDLWLRVQSAPTTREARKGAMLALFLIGLFVIAIPALVAFAALVVFPPVADAANAAVGADAYGIIPAFILRMSPALQILMVLGLISCQMSTVDTFANVTAMPICFDLAEPMAETRGPRNGVRATRRAQGISVVALLLGLGYALVSESLADVYYLSSGVLSACIAVPVAAMFWRRANSAGVLAAIVAGFVGTLGMYYLEYHTSVGFPDLLTGSRGYLYVGTGVLLSAITLVTVSLLTARPSEARCAAVRPQPAELNTSLEPVSEGSYSIPVDPAPADQLVSER
jgi:solute:Na+ symporter, SSS family